MKFSLNLFARLSGTAIGFILAMIVLVAFRNMPVLEAVVYSLFVTGIVALFFSIYETIEYILLVTRSSSHEEGDKSDEG